MSEHFDKVYFSVSKFCIFSAKFNSIVVLQVAGKEDTKSFYWVLWPAEAVFVLLISRAERFLSFNFSFTYFNALNDDITLTSYEVFICQSQITDRTN